MSEWHHRTSQHLHSVPVHRSRREFTRRQLYTLLALVAAMVAVVVWYLWQEKPRATSAAANTAAAAVQTPPAPTARPGTAVPQRKPVEKSPPIATTMPKDGTYLVGRQIKTGTYITPGPDAGKCYWARLRDTSGEMRAVIAASYKAGQQIVTIRRGDRAFVTDGCGPWELVTP